MAPKKKMVRWRTLPPLRLHPLQLWVLWTPQLRREGQAPWATQPTLPLRLEREPELQEQPSFLNLLVIILTLVLVKVMPCFHLLTAPESTTNTV